MLTKFLSEYTLDLLHNNGITDDQINNWTNNEILVAWLQYEGIIGYANKIENILCDLISSREAMR